MKKSVHNLSHYRLTTQSMGRIHPIACMEVLPGDRFTHSTSVLCRVGALVAPLMHPVQLVVHHWYVPNRLIWNEFEEFITGRSAPVHPYLTQAGASLNELEDSFGLPIKQNQTYNALPTRAYQMIYNEFYRDQDIDTAAAISLASGADATTDKEIKRARWAKDYFTTARLYPQYGSTGVTIPFQAGTEAPVKGIGFYGTTGTISEGQANVRETDPLGTRTYPFGALSTNAGLIFEADSNVEASAKPSIYADLSEVTDGGIDVNEFRTAMARQRFLEARNRFGSRYTDYLRFLGLRPSDSRLQRPEYLGGGRQTISFSEVLATAEGTNTVVGEMAGHGIAALRTPRYRRFFEEHGFVITVLFVRPHSMYSQQKERFWDRATKDDYWQKENEAEGPQPVYLREIYGQTDNPTTIFGWQGRHDEYRRQSSAVTGAFRSTFDAWHLARQFSSDPALNSTFVGVNARTDIFQSPSEPHLYINARHNIKAVRLVSSEARY